MTIQQALNWARRHSRALDPQADTRWPAFLLADLLKMSPAQLLAAYPRELADEQYEAYTRQARRVINGEPLQYVLGHWAFCGREFFCDARALIPREDTETLVRAALAALPRRPARILDIGCGTGCIGITMKLERPDDTVRLCDISPEALALAGENAQTLGADVELFQHDMRRTLPPPVYDALLSNPPYIGQGERALMDAAVLGYEPPQALFAGEDGMEYYHALLRRAQESLLPGGILAVECGFAQAGKIEELFAPVCAGVSVHQDTAGIDRVILGRKRI